MFSSFISASFRSPEARKTARWYSSWILFISFWPIVALYCVWIPLTLMGKLDHVTDPSAEKEKDKEKEKERFRGESNGDKEWLLPMHHNDIIA